MALVTPPLLNDSVPNSMPTQNPFNARLGSKAHVTLKGTVAWDFWSWFFHQTTSPGLIIGSIEPFLILAIFHRVIQVLKRLSGIQDTGEWQNPNIRDAKELRISSVWDTGDLRFPGVQMPGSRFKTWITLWIITKIKNGSREPLIGPGGVVWWKNQLQKSHATVPLMDYLVKQHYF